MLKYWFSSFERAAPRPSQSLAICEIVFSSKEHLTADQIFEKVKKAHLTISLAPVYQTLHLLSQIVML
ncbi:MAG: transcriptional repressor [Candidatus Hadarchaeaceae archaeon]